MSEQYIPTAAKTAAHKNAQPNSLKGKWSLNRVGAYHLVLLVQFLVLLPHLPHLPTWLSVYGVLVVLSQLVPIKQRIPLKKRGWRVLQLLGFFGGVVGLYLTYRTAFGLDVGVGFLLLCLISKLLELFSRRDGYVVLSLSLFVLAGAFLMNQGLGTTLLVMLGVTGVFYAMIAHNDVHVLGDNVLASEPAAQNSLQNQVQNKPHNHGRLRSLAIVSLLAIPLMVVLFIFFPRLPPLWHINLSGAGAKTGMSDSMSPGDFANLSQSTELAFRVLFEQDNVPEKSSLYWRGMVFSQFDGTTWRASGIANNYAKVSIDSQNFWLDKAVYIPNKNQPNKQAFKLENMRSSLYTVIMQPTNQRWLFALDVPFSPEKNISLTREFNLEAKEVVSQRFTYKARQFSQAKTDMTLSQAMRTDTLALPSTGNAQAREMAAKLFSMLGSDPEKYANAVLGWIRKENFSYTLSPPLLGEERIDSFLFGTRQGFCEHYASAFTFLMRAAGVPARVVVGYQGGELGNDGKSWEVRQMDAHAWTEIWLKGKGWVRVDPTAAIAPERVNSGMSQLTQQQGAALFGTGAAAQLSYQQFMLLQRMRKAMDYVGFVWQRDVVGFDQESQKNSLLKWFNLKNQYQQILAMFALFASLVALVVAVQWWRRRKIWHPVDVPLVKLSKRLAKQGLARKPHEGMLAWLNRVGQQTDQQQMTDDIAQYYRKARYADVGKLTDSTRQQLNQQHKHKLTSLIQKMDFSD